MDKNYLIIYCVRQMGVFHKFLETEEALLGQISICNDFKWEVIFAAKIAVVKEFIG